MFLSLTRVKCRWRLKPFFSSATFSSPTMPLMLICLRFSWSVRGVAMAAALAVLSCRWMESRHGCWAEAEQEEGGGSFYMQECPPSAPCHWWTHVGGCFPGRPLLRTGSGWTEGWLWIFFSLSNFCERSACVHQIPAIGRLVLVLRFEHTNNLPLNKHQVVVYLCSGDTFNSFLLTSGLFLSTSHNSLVSQFLTNKRCLLFISSACSTFQKVRAKKTNIPFWGKSAHCDVTKGTDTSPRLVTMAPSRWPPFPPPCNLAFYYY